MVWGRMATSEVGNLIFIEDPMNKRDYLHTPQTSIPLKMFGIIWANSFKTEILNILKPNVKQILLKEWEKSLKTAQTDLF